MKMRSILAIILSQAIASEAANITLADPVPNTADPITFETTDGGIPYRWTVQMAGVDSGTAVRHVGAWSWEDNSLFNATAGDPPVGWTHTSDWVALTLSTASTFTLKLERQAGVAAPTGADPGNIAGVDSLFPAFTLFSGWDGDGSDHHTYNNRGNVAWAEDISYLDHLDNSTQTTVERSWVLAAGSYTLALGSNAPATTSNRQGYLATFTTAAVPEPSMAGMLIVLAGAVGLRRQKRLACRAMQLA